MAINLTSGGLAGLTIPDPKDITNANYTFSAMSVGAYTSAHINNTSTSEKTYYMYAPSGGTYFSLGSSMFTKYSGGSRIATANKSHTYALLFRIA